MRKHNASIIYSNMFCSIFGLKLQNWLQIDLVYLRMCSSETFQKITQVLFKKVVNGLISVFSLIESKHKIISVKLGINENSVDHTLSLERNYER